MNVKGWKICDWDLLLEQLVLDKALIEDVTFIGLNDEQDRGSVIRAGSTIRRSVERIEDSVSNNKGISQKATVPP